MRRLILAVVLMVSAVGAAWAEDGITVSGEGVVAIVPDMARVTLGVTHRAEAADVALDAVSSEVEGIVKLLQEAGIAPGDMQTSGFYLRRYRDQPNPRDAAQDIVEGFESGNMLSIRIRDIDAVGAIITQVTQAGVNDIRGIGFGVQDDTALLEQARVLAVQDAMKKAAQFAQAAGVELGPLRRMYEQGGGRPGVAFEEASMRSAPVQAGEVGITARVTMVFEIKQ